MSPAEMPAGRELDVLVAETVMGFWFADGQWWGKHPRTPGARAYASACTSPRLRGGSYREADGLPRFSTDLAAAWTVVEKLMERAFDVRVVVSHETAHSCFVRLGLSDAAEFEATDCASAPIAICRAAIAAYGAAPSDDLAAVREAETECHAEERADG